MRRKEKFNARMHDRGVFPSCSQPQGWPSLFALVESKQEG
jgi:hypothetical protein